MRPPPFIARALARLSIVGLIALAAVAAGGRLLEQQRFGADTSAARERVAAAVQTAVRQLQDRLERVAHRRDCLQL